MKSISFVYPSFERHAHSHPELQTYVPCDEYFGSPSLGIAQLAAITPPDYQIRFTDDRIHPFDPDNDDADLYALSFFTPAASRAIEIGKDLVRRGKNVVMGGIFPTVMPEELKGACTTVVRGEGEPVWQEILQDVAQNCLKPYYQSDAPWDLSLSPTPRVDLYIDSENGTYAPDDYPLQICRGCPVGCSACAIPNVMGKRFRFFPEETNLEAALNLFRRGKRLCITEDTLFLPGNRQKFKQFLFNLHEATDRQPLRVSYIGISMPMILAMDDALLRSLVKIGVNRFYLVCGFDPITQQGLGAGEADALAKCERAIARCHEFGILPYASLLVGTDVDDPGVFDRMLEFTHRTKVEMAEFAISTPYPGTPIWHRYLREGRILSREWRKYNDANVVFRPAGMTPEELLQGYLYLWKEFYKSKAYLKELGHEIATIQF